jgi:16S rRNA (cytidine1402-2'-O)-methyltransferase
MASTQNNIGTLYVVATPIGNLDDITLRALETLKLVDIIFAEDTRVIAKLLARVVIEKSLQRYDEHAHELASNKIIELLREGKKVALVSDAGTPGIADPGSRLVARVREEVIDAHIVPIPGVSAVTTILSVSGMNANQFVFLGYPPHKKGRKTFFETLQTNEVWPVVMYESPHRIEKALASISDVCGNTRTVVVGRELTKIHEDIWKGSIEEARTIFSEAGKDKNRIKGEFVIVIAQP